MLCTNCGVEINDEVRFCHHCGTPVKKAEMSTPIEKEDNPKKESTSADIPKSNKWVTDILGIIFWIVLGIIVYKLWILPSVIPNHLWDEALQQDAYVAVAEYLNKNIMQDATIQYKSVEIQCEKNNPENEFASLVVSGLENSDKTLYNFTYTAAWDIHQDGTFVTTIYTTTDTISHPRLFGDYEYIRFTVVEDNSVIESYRQLQEQENFKNAFQIVEYTLMDCKYGKTNYSIAIHFKWTNTSGVLTSPFAAYDISMFQDGVELEADYYNTSDINSLSDIKPGITIDNFEAFRLNNLTSPVEVVITTLEGSMFDSLDAPTITDIVEINVPQESFDSYLGSWVMPYESNLVAVEVWQNDDGSFWVSIDASTSNRILYGSTMLTISETDQVAFGQDADEWTAITAFLSFRDGELWFSGNFEDYSYGVLNFDSMCYRSSFGK